MGVSKDVALQATSYTQVRIGLSKEAMDVFRTAMLKLHEFVGLVVVDEGTEEWLTAQDNDSASTASTVPDDRGSVVNVYEVNVPPWYSQSAVVAMLSTTGDSKYVVDRMWFSVGELRTCSWKVIGPNIEKLVGHLRRCTEGGTPIHIVSAKESKGKRDQ